MISTSAFSRWFDSAMQRLSSWWQPGTLCNRAAPPRTDAPFKPSNTNWRPLSASSNGRSVRYLVQRNAIDHLFSVSIYDLRTGLCWRSDFHSQHDRNAYINDLRSGRTASWPQFLLHAPTANAAAEHELS